MLSSVFTSFCDNPQMAPHSNVLYVGNYFSQMRNMSSIHEFCDNVFDDLQSTEGLQKHIVSIGSNQTCCVIIKDCREVVGY